MRLGRVANKLSAVSRLNFRNGQYFLLKLINLKDLSRCPCCPWYLSNSKIYNTYYTLIYKINIADRQTIGQFTNQLIIKEVLHAENNLEILFPSYSKNLNDQNTPCF